MTYSQEPFDDPNTPNALDALPQQDQDDDIAPGQFESFDAITAPDPLNAPDRTPTPGAPHDPADPNTTYAGDLADAQMAQSPIPTPPSPLGPTGYPPAQPSPQAPYAQQRSAYAPYQQGYPPYQQYPQGQYPPPGYQGNPAYPAYPNFPQQGSVYAPYQGNAGVAQPASPQTAQAQAVETLYETNDTLLPELRLGEDARDVMRYLTRDLLAFVEDGWYSLAHALHVPTQTPLERPHDVYLQQPQMFVELLNEDVERLLTDGIITGVQVAFVPLDRRQRNRTTGKMFFHAIYRRIGYAATGADDQSAAQRISQRASQRRSSVRPSSSPTGVSSVRRTRQLGERTKMSLLMSRLREEPDMTMWLMFEWNADRMNAPATAYQRPLYHFNWEVNERSGEVGHARYHHGAFHFTSVEVRSTVNTIAGQLP